MDFEYNRSHAQIEPFTSLVRYNNSNIFKYFDNNFREELTNFVVIELFFFSFEDKLNF